MCALLFWDVTPPHWVMGSRYFEWVQGLHRQGRRGPCQPQEFQEWLFHFFNLKYFQTRTLHNTEYEGDCVYLTMFSQAYSLYKFGEKNVGLLVLVSLKTLMHTLFIAEQPPNRPGSYHCRGFAITHSDTPQSVGLLWTSDQPDAETST